MSTLGCKYSMNWPPCSAACTRAVSACTCCVARVRRRVELVVAVAPGLLGGVHGLVGVAHQGIGVGVVLREQGLIIIQRLNGL